MHPSAISSVLLLLLATLPAGGATPARQLPPLWAEYFAAEVAAIEGRSPVSIASAADWEQRAPALRLQLQDMLGLNPWPERTPLQPVVTGTTEHEEFRVERLHFQSSPGLYVTGNLYLPKEAAGPLPAILYVCGHGPVKKDGVSYGNKVTYQHHGAWFARHGYVCLTIDTIQLGELEGLHHGTYREGMWWWNSRGYTPAGVEAWNSIRAIDYLQSRPEVDPERIGITGRSGGGAYSWWTAALDERVKVAVPVAGITDLHNHVLDGAVEGHCDCMFMVNTHRWDYAQVAALVAPRPLLIANTDRDPIFPLDGVQRVHREVAELYRRLGKEGQLGLLITEGPHKDTQDLQVATFRWFNRFLKGEDPLIRVAAEKLLEPEQLKVFTHLPADEITTRIHDTFVPAAEPVLPDNGEEWEHFKDKTMAQLRKHTFAGWPEEAASTGEEVFDKRFDGVRVRRFELETQPGLSMPLIVVEPRRPRTEMVRLEILDHAGWQRLAGELKERFGMEELASPVAESGEGNSLPAANPLPGVLDQSMAFFAPRGSGWTAPDLDARGFVHFRRRFMLVGQTLDGMRVWDIRRAVSSLSALLKTDRQGLAVHAAGPMAVNTLHAALFEPAATSLSLRHLPESYRQGPDYLNIMRVVSLPVVVAMAAEGRQLEINESPEALSAFRTGVARRIAPGTGR
ncbi:MAG TPA: acetylxylan esterase [Verrucomicrobiales bacterium]|nr:acetylxylan esterase [Verrucomicrobiales bacterium]